TWPSARRPHPPRGCVPPCPKPSPPPPAGPGRRCGSCWPAAGSGRRPRWVREQRHKATTARSCEAWAAHPTGSGPRCYNSRQPMPCVGRRAPGLLGAIVHPHADAVAGVVAGAGGVLPPRVFVGDVVTVDAAVVDITAVGVVTVAAVRVRLADGDVGIALAPVGLVDATPGHAADHRTHRGTDVLPAAVADLAAEYRAGNAADHGGDQTAVVVAPRLPVRVGVAVVTAAAIAVITIAVRIGAIGIGGDIAVATGLALALPVHGPGAAVEDRIHPHHARPVVAVVGIAVARADRIGTAQTVSVIALASRAMAVIAVGRGTVAVVVGLRGG